MVKRWAESLLLAALVFVPVWLARSAAAVDSTCNGTSIGGWCNLRYEDQTVCQDCAYMNCNVGCIGHNSQEYHYCITISFMWCLS